MKTYSLIIGTFVALVYHPLQAETRLSVSAKVIPSTWSGSNHINQEADFKAKANQLSLGVGLQRDRWYGSLSAQGGKFEFDTPAPQIVKKNSKESVNDVSVTQGELDLVLGYYFWPSISLFTDIKNITNEWQDKNHRINYGGLGFGISGFRQLEPNWILFGSIGLVRLSINTGGENIGTGVGSALELGLSYRLADSTNLSFGIKSHSQELRFDFGETQTHHRGGLFLGIQQLF